jgi:hypothetical protein
MMLRCQFFDRVEFKSRQAARSAALDAYRVDHPELGSTWNADMRQIDRQYMPLGSMWFCPWYHDPERPDATEKRAAEIARLMADPNPRTHLSIHYWQDWATIRPPIEVMGPNGSVWCVDAKSSNGSGWQVTGTPPDIVCSPSIWLRHGDPTAYHGFIGQNGAGPGWFSDNLERNSIP